MSLGDVLPAIQQGAIDGAVTAWADRAYALLSTREIRDDDQSTVDLSSFVEVNKKW